MKILVTGGAGFIGSNVVDLLVETGHKVAIIDNLSAGSEKNINKKVKLFRPPYGVTNPNIKKAIKKMNYTSIGWSVKSHDTRKNSEEILKGIKNYLIDKKIGNIEKTIGSLKI